MMSGSAAEAEHHSSLCATLYNQLLLTVFLFLNGKMLCLKSISNVQLNWCVGFCDSCKEFVIAEQSCIIYI